MAQERTIELVAAPSILNREHGVAVPYPRIWRAAVEGTIPAIRVGKRWFIEVDRLAEVASILAPQ
jgi:hypothetical protein